MNDAPILTALTNLTIVEDAGLQTVNLTGIEWMPFIRLERTRSTGPASSRSFNRDSTSGMIAGYAVLADRTSAEFWREGQTVVLTVRVSEANASPTEAVLRKSGARTVTTRRPED